MSDTFGGARRIAPAIITSTGAGPTSVEITGTPQYITIQASGGAATIKFAPTSAAPGGTAWPLASGETVDYLVQASNPFLHVVTGTVIWHKS